MLVPMRGLLFHESYNKSTGKYEINKALNPDFFLPYNERLMNIELYNSGVRWRELEGESRRATGKYFDKDGKNIDPGSLSHYTNDTASREVKTDDIKTWWDIDNADEAREWLRNNKGHADYQEASARLNNIIIKSVPSGYEGLPYKEIVEAYSHSTRNPEGMAKLEKEWLDNELSGLSDVLKEELDEQNKGSIPEIISEFKAKYLEKLKSVWASRSGVYSGFIAGRSKLNSKQVDNRNNSLDKAEEAFGKWLKAEKAMILDETGITAKRMEADRLKAVKKAKVKQW